MDLPRHVYRLPAGRRPVQREQKADVIPLRFWRFTFASQFGLSIWTDDPQRIDITAPGQMRFADALEWARQRVPGDWMMVGCYRHGRVA